MCAQRKISLGRLNVETVHVWQMRDAAIRYDIMISKEQRDYLELQAQKHQCPQKEQRCSCTHVLRLLPGIA